MPPGHLVIFYEHLAHEVTSVPVKKMDLRLFIGWRLTDATTPLISDISKRMDEQGIIRIKSGQECPMHAALHWYGRRLNTPPPTSHFPRANCTVSDYAQPYCTATFLGFNRLLFSLFLALAGTQKKFI